VDGAFEWVCGGVAEERAEQVEGVVAGAVEVFAGHADGAGQGAELGEDLGGGDDGGGVGLERGE
jgi:hypothetical protein